MSSIISKTLFKKIAYTGAGSMFALGFYRGNEQYNHYHIKTIKKKAKIEDYMCSFVFGVINGSFYANPALCGFAIYDEYKKVKTLIGNEFNETEYYNNIFFGKNI